MLNSYPKKLWIDIFWQRNKKRHWWLPVIYFKYHMVQVNSVGAQVLEFIADFGKPTAPLPAAIVACVPKKVHIEEAGETEEFKISSTEITDAIIAGLDEPIEPEPEVPFSFT